MKKGRKIVGIFCLVMFVLLSGGCTQKEASKTQLQSDLSESKRFLDLSNRLDVAITDFEIIKRQTTAADKIDTVWVSVDVTGSTVKGKLYYKMIYNLYNDGWKLEDVIDDETDSWSFVPLCGASDELINSSLPDGVEILSTEVDLENMFHRVNYRYVEEYPYCDVIHTKQHILRFGADYYNYTNNKGEWGFWDNIEVETSENWHINGVWTYSGANIRDVESGTLKIEDFSPLGIGYSGFDKGVFDVRGTYQYQYDQAGGGNATYTLTDEDGVLVGSFRRDSEGEIKYEIEATGDCWFDSDYSTPENTGEKTHSIIVTREGLYYKRIGLTNIELIKVN